MNALLNEAKSAGELDDQSVVQNVPDRVVTPEGKTPARLVSYIELGSHMAYHNGAPTKDKPMVRGKFELLGKAHRNEHTDSEGNTKVWYNTIEFGMGKFRELPLSSNEKANFFKLLKKMIAGRSGIKHMAEMLGEGFMIEITHNKSDDGKTTYANMKKDGEWTISAPFFDQMDADGNITPTAVPVPQYNEPLQLLLQKNPTQGQWDSLFIDGTWKKKDDKGNETEVSKNFIQERVRQSASFEGSVLQEMLGGISGLTLEEEPEDQNDVPEVLDDENTPPPVDEAPDGPADDNSGAENPLAALGL